MTLPQTTGELESLRSLAYELVRRDPAARDAHLRLYEIEQMLGRPDVAVEHLRAATRSSRIVSVPAGRLPAERTVLAISRIARWEANTPLELIVDSERTTLDRYYLDDRDDALPAEALPPYDVLFNAIAESEAAHATLDLAQRIVEREGVPVLNAPGVVTQLTRAGVAARFAGSTTVVAPPVERVTAAVLRARVAAGPFVVRPVGSQAGYALARIDDTETLRAYLDEHPHDAYFVTPFVDYRSDDGLFRKYRVMFVGGTPYACHLAISPRWMIHYYNAAMAEHAWMRDEEARFVADVASVFSGPLADALREIAAAVPLEYFGIDCALARDGRLLLFEADAAMLVHGTDPPGLYPYKRAAFTRIQNALTELFERSGIAR